MWTAAEISAGTARLVANKLTVSDQETLAGIFKLYLKSLAADPRFSGLKTKLSEAVDESGGKTASKLAATLVILEENGFSLAELQGGRSGLQTNNAGEMVLKIRLSLTLLGYDLPEEFSGTVESDGNEQFGLSKLSVFPSTTVKSNPGW